MQNEIQISAKWPVSVFPVKKKKADENLIVRSYTNSLINIHFFHPCFATHVLKFKSLIGNSMED